MPLCIHCSHLWIWHITVFRFESLLEMDQLGLSERFLQLVQLWFFFLGTGDVTFCRLCRLCSLLCVRCFPRRLGLWAPWVWLFVAWLRNSPGRIFHAIWRMLLHLYWRTRVWAHTLIELWPVFYLYVLITPNMNHETLTWMGKILSNDETRNI
jgi:hypothetical protein